MFTKLEDTQIAELNERWSKIAVSNVHDALEKLGYPNQCMNIQIKAVDSYQKLVGPAVTVKGRYLDLTPEERKLHADPNHEKMNAHIYKGCVLVFEGAGEYQSAKVGEFLARGVKGQGANGIVVDGAVRDMDELIKMKDFAVFASAASPFPVGHRFLFEDYDEPISVRGSLTSVIRVDPGDWIVGGRDGVVIVPQAVMYEALEEAEQIEELEIKLRHALEEGIPFMEARRMFQRT